MEVVYVEVEVTIVIKERPELGSVVFVTEVKDVNLGFFPSYWRETLWVMFEWVIVDFEEVVSSKFLSVLYSRYKTCPREPLIPRFSRRSLWKNHWKSYVYDDICRILSIWIHQVWKKTSLMFTIVMERPVTFTCLRYLISFTTIPNLVPKDFFEARTDIRTVTLQPMSISQHLNFFIFITYNPQRNIF